MWRVEMRLFLGECSSEGSSEEQVRRTDRMAGWWVWVWGNDDLRAWKGRVIDRIGER